MNEERFIRALRQGGTLEHIEIWIDRETGVHYLWRKSGYAGGLTPLLDADGKPVVSRPAP